MKDAVVRIGLCLALGSAVACGKSEEQQAQEAMAKAAEDASAAMSRAAQATDGAADEMATGMAEMSKGLAAMAESIGSQQTEPVGFRELQTFFPDIDGWTKDKPSGEQISMGIKMSRADVRYQKGDAVIRMEITDSSLNQAMIAPFAMMLASGYEKESATGFERSATVGGQAGWEKWDLTDKSGELNAVVGKRFIVKIAGGPLDDLAPLHALASKANLGRLSELTPAP